MALNVEDRIARLDPERRRRIEERAAELVAEEMTLRQLRRARQLTQAHVATELGITQDGVSRLEQRSDLLLSTLRKTVEAMGGSLSLIARFPDRPPVELSGIADDVDDEMVNVWRLMAFGEEGYGPQMIQWAIDNNRIAIGWSEVGNLIQYATPAGIQKRVRDIFGGPRNPGGAPTAGIQLWNFRGGSYPFHARAQNGPDPHRLAMRGGDLIILKTRRRSRVMRVKGPYEYVARGDETRPPFGYQHQRKAEITCIDGEALWRAARPMLPGQNKFNALVRCHDVGQAVVNNLSRN